MPARRWPFECVAELRGVQAASQWADKETGEVRHSPAKAKLEIELPDGDVMLAEVSASQFEKASGGFDFNTAKRGDRVRLVGLMVIQEGYPQVLVAEAEPPVTRNARQPQPA